MAKKFHIGTLTVDQQLKMESSARREADIEMGLNFNRHRVHASKKAYKRNTKHKGREI